MNGIRAFFNHWGKLLAFLLITVLFIYSAKVSFDASQKANESVRRIDLATKQRLKETCATQKVRYTAGVLSLSRTYRFLEESTPAERRSTINKFILAGLARQEQDLRNIVPASFCRNIGPPVPNFPKRPQSLKFTQ